MGPGTDQLGLERIRILLSRIGDPHRHLPPVFHVAGTNGKGSTCAFLRAAIEAAGLTCHVYTSPHLVRFNERIRPAGRLIDDAGLAALLDEVLAHAEGIGASFFEVTTAAAFLAFARTPAHACVIEVGLGGRLDATNVIPSPAVCGIAALGLDHQAFLGDTIEGIAAEKAGIAKPGVPLVTMRYPEAVWAVIAGVAERIGAPLLVQGRAWDIAPHADALAYHDSKGELALPPPTLAGAHQANNLGLATAMVRQQRAIHIPEIALAAASRRATWPARLQLLSPGPLTAMLPPDATLWLDGGHNPSAGEAIAAALGRIAGNCERPLSLVVGMLANKDAKGLLAPLANRVRTLLTVPVPGHAHHAPAELAAIGQGLGIPASAGASDVSAALQQLAAGSSKTVLILGSLYLAGEVLAANGEAPS